MSKKLLYSGIIFTLGCIVGIYILNPFINKNPQNTSELNNDEHYFIETYEDNSFKKEGYNTSDSLFIRYNLTYYRYPVERLSAIRVFVDDKPEVKSNFSRTFYYINFDTAGYLSQFLFFEKGQVKYQHDFDRTTRIPPGHPTFGNSSK